MNDEITALRIVGFTLILLAAIIAACGLNVVSPQVRLAILKVFVLLSLAGIAAIALTFFASHGAAVLLEITALSAPRGNTVVARQQCRDSVTRADGDLRLVATLCLMAALLGALITLRGLHLFNARRVPGDEVAFLFGLLFGLCAIAAIAIAIWMTHGGAR